MLTQKQEVLLLKKTYPMVITHKRWRRANVSVRKYFQMIHTYSSNSTTNTTTTNFLTPSNSNLYCICVVVTWPFVIILFRVNFIVFDIFKDIFFFVIHKHFCYRMTCNNHEKKTWHFTLKHIYSLRLTKIINNFIILTFFCFIDFIIYFWLLTHFITLGIIAYGGSFIFFQLFSFHKMKILWFWCF